MNIDYHIHTQYCNHARASIEDYVKESIKKGFLEILFLDHLTLCEQDFKNSMTPKEVPLYFYSIKNAAKRYKDKITVKCGLEVDFHPDFFSQTKKICEKFDFDMIGASVHFTKGFNIVSRRSLKDYKDIPHEEIFDAYLTNLEKMLEFNFFDTLCHIDVISKFDKQINMKNRSILKRIQKIIDKIAQKNLCVEVNTSGFNHPVKRQYPDIEILKLCHKKEICIVPSSDAHSPKEIGRDFDKALLVIKEAGFNKITRFSKREKYEIEI